MIIRFDKIRLHNFISFTDATINLAGTYCTLITGSNLCSDDNAKSNGSGKSSIFNGLCYALTGETAQGISSGIENIYGDPDDCWVELTFHVDSDEFVVKRIKSPRQMLNISMNGVDISGKGIRESTKVLNSYLPDLDTDLLCNIIILGQGLPHKLSKFNPAGRKDILEKLTKSDDMVVFIKDKLEDRQNKLKTALRTAEDSILSSKATITAYNNRLTTVINDLHSIGEFDSESDIDNEIKRLTVLIDSYTNELNSRSVNDYDNALSELKSKQSKVLLDRSDDLRKSSEEISNDMTALVASKASTESYIRSIKTEIKKLESVTDVCPTCGQKLIGVEKPSTVEQYATLHEYEISLEDIKNKINSLNINKANKTAEINSKYEDILFNLGSEIKATEKSAKDLRDFIDDIKSKKDIASENLFKLNTIKMNYAKYLDEVNQINEFINDLNNSIAQDSNEVAVINSRLQIIQQLITLAKREFRGVILANVIEYIDSRVKYYSKSVFDNEGLSFTLSDNKIDIAYNGRMYENLSGGEQQKVDIIIQLALRDMLSKQLGVKSNILVCDEIFDNLDSEGASKIIDVIQNRSEIESLFFITHHAETLGISFDRELVVHKNELGISNIVTS